MPEHLSERDVFTSKQLRLLKRVAKYGNLKTAARSMDISYNAAKQIFYRLRQKYGEYIAFEEEYGSKIDKMLTMIHSCWNCEHLINHVYDGRNDFVKCKEAGTFVEYQSIPRCSLFKRKEGTK